MADDINLGLAYVHGPGTDEPLVKYEAGARQFLHADHQGSIVALNDDNGNLVAINAYDPWGVPNAGNQGRFGYTGQAWIEELGLWYYKARFYAARIGRFLQVDPVGYKDQMNLYAYVGNDPLNNTDPDGKVLQITGTPEYQEKVRRQLRMLQSRPFGRLLVHRVIVSKNLHRIVESRRGNSTLPQGPSRNGRGDGSQISFNPDRNTTELPDDAGSYITPAFVQLGHELGHADTIDRGMQSTDMGREIPNTTPPAERQAMRWENWIRHEHGLTPRSYYYPALNK